jgi:hypothetical protein
MIGPWRLREQAAGVAVFSGGKEFFSNGDRNLGSATGLKSAFRRIAGAAVRAAGAAAIIVSVRWDAGRCLHVKLL